MTLTERIRRDADFGILTIRGRFRTTWQKNLLTITEPIIKLSLTKLSYPSASVEGDRWKNLGYS